MLGLGILISLIWNVSEKKNRRYIYCLQLTFFYVGMYLLRVCVCASYVCTYIVLYCSDVCVRTSISEIVKYYSFLRHTGTNIKI